jgi:hypothetical protein
MIYLFKQSKMSNARQLHHCCFELGFLFLGRGDVGVVAIEQEDVSRSRIPRSLEDKSGENLCAAYFDSIYIH